MKSICWDESIMNTHRNATLAGLFILISVGLILAVVLAIRGGGALAEKQYTCIARFQLADDLGGLRSGDDVRVGGYRVGSVNDIQPADLNTDRPVLLVTFSLPVRYVLHADATVGVQSSLTGATCLNIQNLGSTAKPAAVGYVTGAPDPKTRALSALADASGDINAITRDLRSTTIPKVNSAVDMLHGTGSSANQLVQHLDGKVDPIIERYNQVTEKTGGMMDSIHQMIGPGVMDWHGILADLHHITSNINGRLPELLDKVDHTVDSTETALTSVQHTLENTTEISDSVRSVLVANRGKLDEIVASIKETGDNLKSASIEIRHSPWRLLYHPTDAEMSNLNVFDAARQFADGANALNDAAQALRDAAQDKRVDPKRLRQLMDNLNDRFAKFHDVEQKLWTDVKR